MMDLEELKRIAEKKLGKSWDEIMIQADKDTEKQKNLSDPIAIAYKNSSISPKAMFKKSMNELKILIGK